MIVAETDQQEIDVSRQFFVIHLSIFKKKRGQSFSSKFHWFSFKSDHFKNSRN